MDNKRLIEETIPLEDISFESAREKSIRHGHISTLHIWWARRPLVASRAAVFGSLVIPSKISKETLKKTAEITKRWLPEYKKIHITDEDLKDKELYHFMRVLCTWEASNNDEIINQAREIIRESHDGKSPKVLDPFAGGGSIPLEALRLGCDTYANELNPVAHIIELCTLVYPQKYGKWVDVEIEDDNKKNGQLSLDNDSVGKKTKRVNKLAEDVQKWGNWVLEEVKKEIGSFYKSDSENSTAIAYLWARTIKCSNPSCGKKIPLIQSFILADREKEKIYLSPSIDDKIDIPNFKIINKEVPGETTKRGNAICLFCHQVSDVKYVRKQGLSNRITYTPLCKVFYDDKEKQYTEATKEDFARYNEASLKLKEELRKEPNLYPNEAVPPPGAVAFRIPLYGINEWGQLFNDRQLLFLITAVKKIRLAYVQIKKEVKDEDYAIALVSYLSSILDKLADYNSTLCRWVSKEFIGSTFSRQSLSMVWDYAEVNPFSGFTGSWENALNWVISGIKEISFTSINKSVQVINGDATRLSFIDNMFDAVITDPPYYDSITYAEISDFFYVWLKRTLGNIRPKIFKTPLTPKEREIVHNPPKHKGDEQKSKEFYEKLLTEAFLESNRVLVDNGIFLTMFTHKSTSAWEKLIQGVIKGKFFVTSTWPVETERKTRSIAINNAAVGSSTFLIARKRTNDGYGFFDDVKQNLVKDLRIKLKLFWNSGIRGADFFISAIGPAVEVFGKYSKVKKLSGEEVSVAEFLNLVREEVTSYALEKILSEGNISGIDPETRFYILWRWAYDGVKVPFDDARILAQAIGAEIDELMSKTGVLKKSGENVELLGPFEIKVTKAETIIDVLHRSCQLWSQGKKQELANFLEESGRIKDGLFWSTAQAISEVLPDGDKEKQLLQGFLASRSGIAEAVKQGKLF